MHPQGCFKRKFFFRKIILARLIRACSCSCSLMPILMKKRLRERKTDLYLQNIY